MQMVQASDVSGAIGYSNNGKGGERDFRCNIFFKEECVGGIAANQQTVHKSKPIDNNFGSERTQNRKTFLPVDRTALNYQSRLLTSAKK
jgi:hypothetical protein